MTRACKRPAFLRGAVLVTVLGAAMVPAGAADCWVPDAPPSGIGPRMPALARAAELLRQDPAIQSLSEVRLQSHRHSGIPHHPGAPATATASVWLHARDVWDRACGLKPWADRVHPANLSLHLNTLESVTREAGPDDSGLHATLAPVITGRVGGYPVYEHRVLVITPPGVPAFVPVTAGQWLDAWQRHLDGLAATARRSAQADLGQDWGTALAQLERTDPKAAAELRQTLAEARRAASDDDPTGERAALSALRTSLTPAQRDAPAWVSAESLEHQRFALAPPDADDAQALVQINPALWRGAGPKAVRVVALEVYLNRSGVFDRPLDPLHAAAQGWLSRVDPRPYTALLTP